MSWQTRTLGEVCDEVNGTIKTGPFGTQLHSSDYSAGGTPVVMPQDIVDDKISTEKIARVSKDHVQRLSQHRLSEGDIVYGRRGDIGRHALITSNEAGWLCGTGCLRISLGQDVLDSRFLHYYLSAPSVVDWIYNQAVGATMPNLNTSILRSVPVSFPSLPSQQRIAGVLSGYDNLIENNTRRIEIMEEMAQAIYQEWFVNLRFPGHEQVEMVESELGPVPEGWSSNKLGDICDLTLGQSPKSEFYNEDGEGLPFHQGVTDFGDRFPTTRVYCTIDKRVAEAGDILFSVRAPVGRINIADQKLVIGRGLHAIRHKEDQQEFLYYQLKDKFREEDTMGGGTIFKSVTKRDMLGIDLLVPPKTLIAEFESIVQPISALIATLSRQQAVLQEIRNLLLPKLVSGEVGISSSLNEAPEAAVA